MTGAQTVLFVDDEPLVARLYARAAASLGLETRFAEDGGLALAQIAASPPDIIVSDWLMPGMSGLELAEALVRKQLKTMPLILLSAREGGATLQSGLAHGADDFLLKGVSFETVIARLRFWMQAPLPGLPPDARARARAGLAHYRPGHDPVLLLQMPRDLLIERASIVVIDQLLAAPKTFGGTPAERERLLGLIAGTLFVLGRTDPLSLVRHGDHVLAVIDRLGEGWRRRLAADLRALDRIGEQATYRHAMESFILLP